MYPSRYFNQRYYAPRYFPKVGAAAAAVTYARNHRYGLRARMRVFVVIE